jgi:HK97 gp10 family phage protein
MAIGKSYNRFPQIIATLDPRLEAALHVGRQAIASEARARVHVASGELRDSIHVDGDYIVAGDSDTFYGHFEEFGTVHSPAHPFMVPAAEARREEVVGLAAAALRKL